MNVKRLKGTQDILPDMAGLWQYIEETSRRVFSLYGYREIRTPIIEEAGLFTRSVGKETDIVKKQMYSFKDQGERDISLRPEETASVARAYIENNLGSTDGFVKFYYIGPMFRSERPQAGRFRQFNQIGVEAIGSYSPYLDAEIIILLNNLLKSLGITGYAFMVNSLGCKKDKSNKESALRKGLRGNLGLLCKDCQRRYKTNILRILDCKHINCKRAAGSVLTETGLCKDCDKRFVLLQDILRSNQVNFVVTPTLVRGLDYYTGIVFEVKADNLGAQDAIAAGGRYDNLILELGAKPQGATGFAIGVERVIQSLSENEAFKADGKGVLLFIATIGEEAYKKGFSILSTLRSEGIASDIDYQQKSLKAQMRYANKVKAEYVLVLGENELKERKVFLRNMNNASQKEIGLDSLVEEVKKLRIKDLTA